MVKKRRDEQEFALTEPITLEETVSTTDLKSSLEEIKNYPGVIGYILRSSTSASIDLKDPTKIIDYAIVSSSALDAGTDGCAAQPIELSYSVMKVRLPCCSPQRK